MWPQSWAADTDLDPGAPEIRLDTELVPGAAETRLVPGADPIITRILAGAGHNLRVPGGDPMPGADPMVPGGLGAWGGMVPAGLASGADSGAALIHILIMSHLK